MIVDIKKRHLEVILGLLDDTEMGLVLSMDNNPLPGDLEAMSSELGTLIIIEKSLRNQLKRHEEKKK